MFFGCLVSLLNLCRLKYWQAPMWYGVVFVFSQLYSKASHVFPHVCRLRIMGIIGVRQIVISGQWYQYDQYASTGLPSATSIIFSCQQVTPEISYLQSLALFHITSFWSDQDPRGNQCSIIPPLWLFLWSVILNMEIQFCKLINNIYWLASLFIFWSSSSKSVLHNPTSFNTLAWHHCHQQLFFLLLSIVQHHLLL